MNNLLFGILMATALLAAWHGYGSLLLRAAGRGEKSLLSERIVAGLFVYMTALSLLSLAALYTLPAIVLLLAGGSLLTLFDLRQGLPALDKPAWPKGDKLLQRAFLLFSLLCLGLCLLRLLGNIHLPDFGNHDDRHGYYAIIERLIDLGTFGIDPFIAHRLTAGLGGHNLIQGTISIFSGPTYLMLLDPGICFLLGFVFLYEISRRHNLPLLAAALLFAAYLNIWTNRGNSTAENISTFILMFAVYELWQLYRNEGQQRLAAVLVPLALFIAMTLKTTLIPISLGFFILYALWFVSRNRDWKILEPKTLLILLGAGALFYLPLMYQLKQSNGTWLYPLLGGGTSGGYHAGVRDMLDFAGWRAFFFSFVFSDRFLLPAVLTALAIWAQRKRPLLTFFTLSVLLAPTCFIALMIYSMGGHGAVFRYFFPLYNAFPPILFFLAAVSLQGEGRKHWTSGMSPLLWIAALAILAWTGLNLRLSKNEYAYNVKSLMAHASGSLTTAPAYYQEAQEAIPEGARTLVYVHFAYTLDFARNDIWLVDAPGMSAPGGYTPFHEDAQTWLAYFREHGIEYVLYEYHDGAGVRELALKSRQPDHYWSEVLFGHIIMTQDAIQALRDDPSLSELVFEDDKTFVIRL